VVRRVGREAVLEHPLWPARRAPGGVRAHGRPHALARPPGAAAPGAARARSLQPVSRAARGVRADPAGAAAGLRLHPPRARCGHPAGARLHVRVPPRRWARARRLRAPRPRGGRGLAREQRDGVRLAALPSAPARAHRDRPPAGTPATPGREPTGRRAGVSNPPAADRPIFSKEPP
jgi:hypothetical protein